MRNPLVALAGVFCLTMAPLAFAQRASNDSSKLLLDRLTQELPGRALPAASVITSGTRTVPSGAREAGDVATTGPLAVHGDVAGSVYAMGDITVGSGGHVHGDAIAVGGKVRLDGGTVDGDMRSVAPAATVSPEDEGALPARARSPFYQATGWLVVLLLIGLGTLVFADRYLDGVVKELERSFTRAFLIGIAGELALLPALLLICVGLALTVLGILLIPAAFVAFVLAVAGLFTIGYLGVASVVGGALVRDGGRLSARGAALRALLAGLVILLAFWLLSGLVSFSAIALMVTRGIAVAITWVAATAGFGAALASRGGALRRRPAAIGRPSGQAEDLSWQTPTPVRGVAAARRPTTTAGDRR
jgi:hypothetical protein